MKTFKMLLKETLCKESYFQGALKVSLDGKPEIEAIRDGYFQDTFRANSVATRGRERILSILSGYFQVPLKVFQETGNHTFSFPPLYRGKLKVSGVQRGVEVRKQPTNNNNCHPEKRPG